MTGPQPGYPPPYPPPPVGMGYPPPPPPPSAPPAPARPRKNPLLGRFALALALLMTAVATVSVIPLANIQAQMVVSLGTVDIDTSMLGEAWMASASSPMMTWLGSLFGAVVAIVIGIVAVVSARGRGPGVAAIVVGILSPVAWIACWIAILVPATIAVG